MKTKQIKGKLDILLVDGLPKGARKFHYFNDKDSPYLFYMIGVNTFREYDIPQGNWKYISTIEDITEFEADLLMEEMINKNDNHGYKGFGNFDWLSHAVPAFHSLLSANDVMIVEPRLDFYKYEGEHTVEVAQSISGFMSKEIDKAKGNYFSPSTTLIFVKMSTDGN